MLNISPKNISDLEHTLKDLIREGEPAAHAIREFFDSGEDGEFVRSRGLNPEDHRLMKFALLDALNKIGGDEALELLAQRLQTTNDPEEIAFLAKVMETHRPEMHRAEILTAAQKKWQSMTGKRLATILVDWLRYLQHMAMKASWLTLKRPIYGSKPFR